MKKNLLSLSILAVTMMGLVGCDGGGKKPTSSSSVAPGPEYALVLSGPEQHRDFVLKACEEFKATNALYANLKFSYSIHGEDKVDSEVTDWTSVGSPDVYAYASDKILDLYKAGAVSEIPESYIQGIKDMGTGSEAAATFAGKVLAYPYAGDNGYFLYYDKSKLSETDIASMEGLLAKAATLNLKVAYPLKTAFYSLGALFTFGAKYNLTISSTGTVESIAADFDGPNGVKAGKAIRKIMSDKSWQDAQAAPTAANKLVACVDGSWNADAYKTEMKDNFACAKLPTITVDGDTKNLGSYLGYKLYGVNPQKSSGDSVRLGICHALANYLVSEKVQESRFDSFGIAPTNQVVAKMSKVVNTPNIKAINDQAKYATAQTAVPSSIWGAPEAFTTAIAAGEVTDDNIAEYMNTLNKSLKGEDKKAE